MSIFRYYSESFYDIIAIVAGCVQTILYCDFFYLYITKVILPPQPCTFAPPPPPCTNTSPPLHCAVHTHYSYGPSQLFLPAFMPFSSPTCTLYNIINLSGTLDMVVELKVQFCREKTSFDTN